METAFDLWQAYGLEADPNHLLELLQEDHPKATLEDLETGREEWERYLESKGNWDEEISEAIQQRRGYL